VKGILVWSFLAVAFSLTPAAAADNLQDFSYREDFEGKDPVVSWVSDGKCRVNFKGITTEKAYSGQHSFKLDVTLLSGSYHYWQVPLRVPCDGQLKFSARILVGEGTTARVGLGANFVFPPTHHSGCRAIDTFGKPTGDWRLQEADLVKWGKANAESVVPRYVHGATAANVVVYMDRWGIFIYGGAGRRVVVYVDDVRIEGRVPSATDHDAEAARRFQPVQEAFAERVAAWNRAIQDVSGQLEKLPPLSPTGERMKQAAKSSLDVLRGRVDKLQKQGYGTPSEVDELAGRVQFLDAIMPNLRKLAAGAPPQPLLVHVPKAISNLRITPTTFPIPAPIADEVKMTTCAGEYESANFVVYALRDLRGLQVTVTDLKSDRHIIPASAVDCRVVKCWYQAGRGISDLRHKQLVPELLLKDDELVRVDFQKEQNYLRMGGPGTDKYLLVSGPETEETAALQPRDAKQLQPVDIAAETSRQFWLTVHVPERTLAGEYSGNIVLTAPGTARVSLRLRLRVLPFKLVQSPLTYSIYYRGRLTPDGKGSISSETKSPGQYLAEMRDMKAHGVPYPTCYQPYDERLLPRMFELRRQAGLPEGRLFTLGLSTGNPTEPEALRKLQASARQWIAMARRYGYDEVYFYGIDEARGERLKSQRAAWTAVREAGGKIFVACYRGTFEVMGDLLDLAILAGPPQPEEARKYHSVGHQVFCYANPQVGLEEPQTYRRNFGLVLWKAGYDGAMDYAYQHSFGHIWNDFDHSHYRDHVFAYPTADGVVDTVQWEGFREGVDDVRYIATLAQTVQRARKDTKRRQIAEQASKWLASLDPSDDLDKLRTEAIEWLLRLEARK